MGTCKWASHRDNRVGDYNVGGGYKNHLEAYYGKASPEDKARCLELLTSLEIGAAAKSQGLGITKPRRPSSSRNPITGRKIESRSKTAMAAIDFERQSKPPYSTTYGREFAALPGKSAIADPPLDTRASYQASYELSGPVGVSQYESEFYQKLKRKTTPIRTGSASGNRRNNPHPLESFLNWKLPPKPHAERYGSEWAGELTDEILDAVCRGKIRSTYQQDFLGVPQGFQPTAPVKLPVDWKSKVGYSLDSSMRRCYQRPSQQYELKGNTSRYGCNKFKAVPAHGVVPTVSSRQMHLKNRTSYDMDYEGERSGRLHEARDLGRSHAMGALRNQTGVNSGPDFSAVPKLPDIPDCHLCTGPPATTEQRDYSEFDYKRPEEPETLISQLEQSQEERRRRLVPHAENSGASGPLFPPAVQRLRADLHLLQAGSKSG